jgi:hypothetical protein
MGKFFNFAQKYTLQSTGIWERIRRALAIAPERSTGIPLNPQFRNPTPGGLSPTTYDDPVTFPAGDIADNPYWKRDVRRAYPRLSVVNQADVVGLLTVGSKANPKDGVLKVGDAGSKQLMEIKEEGEKGLATFFGKDKRNMLGVFGKDGLPPFPVPANKATKTGEKKYIVNQDGEQGYPEE